MTTATAEHKPFDVEVTLGYVLVYVPVYDCEGKMRSIGMPRPGNQWGMAGANYHWTCKPYLARAKQIARATLRRLAK